MSNLSCDLCYAINKPGYFFPVSDMLFYNMCKKFGAEEHSKIEDEDKRYVCLDCIDTLKKINNDGNKVIEEKHRLVRQYER